MSTKTTPAHSAKLINTGYRWTSKLHQVGKFAWYWNFWSNPNGGVTGVCWCYHYNNKNLHITVYQNGTFILFPWRYGCCLLCYS